MLRHGARLEIGRDSMGHVDVGVTHNVYSQGRCKEATRAVWLPPDFFAIRRKVFRASAVEPGYQSIKKQNDIPTPPRAHARLMR
jgi:hypothetical protein